VHLLLLLLLLLLQLQGARSLLVEVVVALRLV
jgi:hypothetical protein